jgi:hypothetical protein
MDRDKVADIIALILAFAVGVVFLMVFGDIRSYLPF